jgi:hypothetical protein
MEMTVHFPPLKSLFGYVSINVYFTLCRDLFSFFNQNRIHPNTGLSKQSLNMDVSDNPQSNFWFT